jgi:hypothetical protein
MAAFDLPPQLIVPRPAIIRPATPELIHPADPRFQQTVQALRTGQKRHTSRRRSAVAALAWSFVGSCTSATASLDFSALSAGAIQAGDLAIYCDYGSQGSGSVTAVTPSGFSNHISVPGSVNGDNQRGMVSSKKLTGSEGAVTGMNASNNNKVGLVFRPSIAYDTHSALGVNSGSIVIGDPAAQTCNPSAETIAVIVIGVSAGENTTSTFNNFSPAADGTVTTADADMQVRFKIFNSSLESVSLDRADLGNENWLASLYIKPTL